MDIWFSLVLFGFSQLILCWYCYQLAKEKGYSAPGFALLGLIPIFNLLSLMLLLLLPERQEQPDKVFISRFRSRR